MTENSAIRLGDRLEVCEGSWFGRTGTVVGFPSDERRVSVRFDDDGEVRSVVACTTAKLDEQYATELVSDYPHGGNS